MKVTRKKQKGVPSALSEPKPETQKSPGKQKKPATSVESILRKRKY